MSGDIRLQTPIRFHAVGRDRCRCTVGQINTATKLARNKIHSEAIVKLLHVSAQGCHRQGFI
jgi:hypothetical protein